MQKNPKFQPNQSYWRHVIDASNEPPLPSLKDHLNVDVALIGGGYTSLMCAWSLKKQQPNLSVAVLEAHDIGFGSSGRNAGMVLHDLHDNRVNKFGKDAVRFTYEKVVGVIDTIQTLTQTYEFDCDLEQNGYLELALYPSHVKDLEAKQKLYADYGQDFRVIDQQELQSEIHNPAFMSAGFYPHAAQLHPGKYILGLKKAALAEGVQLFERTPVESLRQGETVQLKTSQGSINASAVVLGLNAYHPASGLAPMHNRVVSLFSFIVMTEPLGSKLKDTLGWQKRWGYSDMRHLHNYVRLVDEDRLLFGGRVRYRFGTSLNLQQEQQMYQQLSEEFFKRFPMLSGTRIDHRWCGSVAFNMTQTPTMGVTGRHQNIYYSLGYSGMGVSLATLGGQVLADLYLGRGDRWEGLIYLEDKHLPLPPEPFKFIGFTSKYWWMRWQDFLDSRSKS